MANYKGKDLSPDFKKFFQKEKKWITNTLKQKECTNIQMGYGFYYFSGFFTSPSGQAYYFSCADVRHFNYDKLLIRTARDYKDFTGGPNQYCKTNPQSLLDFKLA
jgi:hypothetical protein